MAMNEGACNIQEYSGLLSSMHNTSKQTSASLYHGGGSGSSTNESDGTYSDVGSSPSSIYLSKNTKEDDDIYLKPTEPHIKDDLSPEVSQSSSLLIYEYDQSSRTTEDNDPHSHVDLPPFVPEATDENSKVIGIEAERENAFGDIEDPKADLKRDHPTRKNSQEQTGNGHYSPSDRQNYYHY
ncbi:hypothetical protein WN944_006152 [Citrus x changshan-huyou]|uniref:Uncharacterized protein n=1 Tax=Citrus x changshan-huyou TaxID=2935761 RepID=A0AAP0MKU1_9ROSI